jgi:hypothetical protein
MVESRQVGINRVVVGSSQFRIGIGAAQGVVLPLPAPGAAGWFPGANQSGYFLLEQ